MTRYLSMTAHDEDGQPIKSLETLMLMINFKPGAVRFFKVEHKCSGIHPFTVDDLRDDVYVVAGPTPERRIWIANIQNVNGIATVL